MLSISQSHIISRNQRPTFRFVSKSCQSLKVSLEDLYNGTSKKLSLSRNVICAKCKGKGSKSGASIKCAGCQGSGMKVSIRHLGPSMIQQMQRPCNECKGTGETINDNLTRIGAHSARVRK